MFSWRKDPEQGGFCEFTPRDESRRRRRSISLPSVSLEANQAFCLHNCKTRSATVVLAEFFYDSRASKSEEVFIGLEFWILFYGLTFNAFFLYSDI